MNLAYATLNCCLNSSSLASVVNSVADATAFCHCILLGALDPLTLKYRIVFTTIMSNEQMTIRVSLSLDDKNMARICDWRSVLGLCTFNSV